MTPKTWLVIVLLVSAGCDLPRDSADTLNRIQGVSSATESDLLETIHGRELDLVIGGLKANSPWHMRPLRSWTGDSTTVLVPVFRLDSETRSPP